MGICSTPTSTLGVPLSQGSLACPAEPLWTWEPGRHFIKALHGGERVGASSISSARQRQPFAQPLTAIPSGMLVTRHLQARQEAEWGWGILILNVAQKTMAPRARCTSSQQEWGGGPDSKWKLWSHKAVERKVQSLRVSFTLSASCL